MTLAEDKFVSAIWGLSLVVILVPEWILGSIFVKQPKLRRALTVLTRCTALVVFCFNSLQLWNYSPFGKTLHVVYVLFVLGAYVYIKKDFETFFKG